MMFKSILSIEMFFVQEIDVFILRYQMYFNLEYDIRQ